MILNFGVPIKNIRLIQDEFPIEMCDEMITENAIHETDYIFIQQGMKDATWAILYSDNEQELVIIYKNEKNDLMLKL